MKNTTPTVHREYPKATNAFLRHQYGVMTTRFEQLPTLVQVKDPKTGIENWHIKGYHTGNTPVQVFTLQGFGETDEAALAMVRKYHH
jgi:hypothetical protein